MRYYREIGFLNKERGLNDIFIIWLISIPCARVLNLKFTRVIFRLISLKNINWKKIYWTLNEYIFESLVSCLQGASLTLSYQFSHINQGERVNPQKVGLFLMLNKNRASNHFYAHSRYTQWYLHKKVAKNMLCKENWVFLNRFQN